jgi:hypothetical protein
MIVVADEFEFDFQDAIDAFVFDQTDTKSPHFHGVSMKGVDIIAEFPEKFVYIEVKEYSNPSSYNPLRAKKKTTKSHQLKKSTKSPQLKNFNWLKNYLRQKFRDTYLFRHAEQKVHKPIDYICLVTFDDALNSHLAKALQNELPVGLASPRWKASLAVSCQVLNLRSWNRNFQQWPVKRLPPSNTAGGTTP